MIRVLIIDDDVMMCDMLKKMVEQMGYGVKCTHTLGEGLDELSSSPCDVVMLDVQLPDGYGLDAIARIKEHKDNPEVIIITGMGDPDGAELAITSGAWDYIEKPASVKQMMLPLVRALQYREGRKKKSSPVLFKRNDIIGSSPVLQQALEKLAQAADSKANVLITGKTGSGKELFATAIHMNSSRAENNFVVVDCAALPESLVESILFGYEKGAFSGADKSKEGLVKQADGGTLFLDEVGELPLSVQKTFLRVLQEHRFRPIGADKEETSDFCLVAATNRNLDNMVKEGRFREDLLFRLRSIVISTPSLSQRDDDIVELVLFYTNKFCRLYNLDKKGFSPDFIDAVTSYEWPGNVRELINTIEHVIIEARNEPILFSYHLPALIRTTVKKRILSSRDHTDKPVDNVFRPFVNSFSLPKFREFKDDMERQYMDILMKTSDGNKKKASDISGLSRPRLYELLKKHGVM